jgi:hypothetical protein
MILRSIRFQNLQSVLSLCLLCDKAPIDGAALQPHARPMELIAYPLAAVGALAVVLVAVLVIASMFQPYEPPHIDPELGELPPAGRSGEH